jgi:molybdopterin-guanine dinucleotide biosynthesis protein A
LIGFLLVGGQGRRIGGNKAHRPFAGKSLYQWAWGNLNRYCSRVVLLGENPPCEGEHWSEPEPGQGPLGAIRFALSQTPDEWNLIVALDYPYLGANIWDQLLPLSGRARLPRCQGQPHPLGGFYHKDCRLEGAGASLLRALEGEDGVHWVDFCDPEPFLNVNRLEDLR